jgi:hypothetical protein
MVFSSPNVNIIKKNNLYELTIYNFSPNSNFWKNTLKFLNIKKKNIQKNKTIITFEAKNIETLENLLKIKKNMLSYRHSELMFLFVGEQFRALEKDNLNILFFDIKDFVIINNDSKRYNSVFLFLNTFKFYPVKDSMVEINKPFLKKNKFLSPELINISSIPAKIHKNSSYYSFAKLICHCLEKFNKDLNLEEMKKHIEKIDKTKLYYALLRCLEEDPTNRFYLYI